MPGPGKNGRVAARPRLLTPPSGNATIFTWPENAYFGSATLFVQLLPAEIGMNLSHHERRKRLEQILFANDVKLQQRLSGLFGAHKNRIHGLTLNEAIDSFWERNRDKLKTTSINSKQGREYVRLRISEWTR